MTDSAALLRGLRRTGSETQLTQALAAICRADEQFSEAFLHAVLAAVGRSASFGRPLRVSAEETVGADRFDLRFRAPGLDVIMELKVHAGYGKNQLERYREALAPVAQRHLIAITRDVPLYGEPEDVGAVRWRSLLPVLRALPFSDELLREQWGMFLGILEEEGSMGFTQPDPALFADFARARAATRHMEQFMRVLQVPLLDALRRALGGDRDAAALYWDRPGRFSRNTTSNSLEYWFKVPAEDALRVAAGLRGQAPPTVFYVRPAPLQRWDIRHLGSEARVVVERLNSRGFDPTWMVKSLPLTDELICSRGLDEAVVSFAHECFVDLRDSAMFALPVSAFRDASQPESDEEFGDGA